MQRQSVSISECVWHEIWAPNYECIHILSINGIAEKMLGDKVSHSLCLILCLRSAKQGISKWHVCITNKCWTHQMAKWCEGWRWILERIYKASRHCNENLLYLAVAHSKGLPSVSYWKGSQHFVGGKDEKGNTWMNGLQWHLMAAAYNTWLFPLW